MIKNLLSADMKAMLDDAIHGELYASHLYRHLSNQMRGLGWFGAQKFFDAESESEVEHYRRHVDFQNDMGTVAKMPALKAMTDTVKDLVDALQLAYETELELYNSYAEKYQKAAKEPVIQQFLLQFLEIQRKSVGEYADLIARCHLAAGDKCGLLLIDQELGA